MSSGSFKNVIYKMYVEFIYYYICKKGFGVKDPKMINML